MSEFEVYALTDVGVVREENQDVVLVALPGSGRLEAEGRRISVEDRAVLVGVADGMGGMPDGDVASALVREAFARSAREAGSGADASVARVRDLFQDAHRRISERNRGREPHERMGTTLTLAWVEGREAIVGNVGDSRLYLLRAGGLHQITTDHSVANLLVRLGHLSEEEALRHPERKVLAQALGHGEELEVEMKRLVLETGDRLLLCSDGVSDMVSPEQLESLLGAAGADLADLAADVVEAAKRAGGFDNISLVVLDCVSVEG